MNQWWNDLSISKKIYGLVGLMIFLITAELLAMVFVMGVLSSVRAFVEGEALWSKAQKDAIHSLSLYALTSEKTYYERFEQHLEVPLGGRQARLELEKDDPDLDVVTQGFQRGGSHLEDIPGLIRLLTSFRQVSYIQNAVLDWHEADRLLDEVIELGKQIERSLREGGDPEQLRQKVEQIGVLNDRLTVLEMRFSSVLGEGSRWLENILKILLGFVVLVVEGTGLYLTLSFSRNMARRLKETTRVAAQVGRGDFSENLPVTSRDELGVLAQIMNRMMLDLSEQIGSRQRAESANQTKSLFLANVSHEIRTPLGVILGFTEALKQPGVSEIEKLQFIETIERTGQDLRRIINDILDISKVEAGHLDIDRVSFPFFEFMKDLENSLVEQAKRNDNVLEFIPETSLPDEVVSDPLRLKQILINVLGNALKFTKRGQVQLRYGQRGAYLYFEVTDTGIGMTSEDSKQLFQPFSQADPSSTRRFGGTGLGLSLSRRLARALGGDVILIQSEIGMGTVFRVTVATAVDPQEQRTVEKAVFRPLQMKPEDLSELRGKKVLVVDDSFDNQALLRFVMEKWGVEVESAANGKEAIERAMTRPFDLVLMDMQMPVMDGYEATKSLRRLNFLKPIVALTAHAMKDDRHRCLAAGCNDYLSKPVDQIILGKTLHALLVNESDSSLAPEA